MAWRSVWRFSTKATFDFPHRSLLRAFPKELLKKIPKKTLAAHYARKAQEGAAEAKEAS